MAGGIYFNGRFTVVPGSYSEVDASALAGISLGATGIVACLGECEGGAPHTVAGPQEVENGGQVGKLFREGDLREAGVMLFAPGNDDNIPGGAQEVKFFKVNPATQSTYTFVDGVGDDALAITSEDYGLFTTRIGVDIEDGTNVGKLITITFDGDEEEFDDVGGEAKFTMAWGGTVGLGVSLVLDLASNLTIDLDEDGITDHRGDYLGETDISGKDGDKTASPTAGEIASVVSSDAADTTQSLIVYGIDNGTGNPASEVISLNGTTVANGTTLWSRIHGYRLSAACAGTVTISGSTPGTMATIAASALSAGLTLLGDSVYNDPDTGYEVDNDALTFVADAATSDRLLIVGYAGGSPTLEEITLNGTTDVVSSETDWEYVNFIAAIETAAARTVTVSGLIWNSGDVVELVSDSASDTQVATVLGTAPNGTPQSEQVTLSGVTAVQTVATFGQVHGVVLATAASGTVLVRSPDDAVLVFSVAPTRTSAGVHAWSGVENSGGATITFANVGTGAAIVYGTDDGDAGAGELAANGASSTSFKAVTYVATSHMGSGETLDIAFNIATFDADQTTIQEMYEALNGVYTGLTMVVNTTESSTFTLDDMDAYAATALSSSAVGFFAVLQDVVDEINRSSDIVTATRSSGSEAAPANTSATTFLAGGVEGTTAFSHWQAALDAARDYRINTIVALTSDEAVHAAVLAHCAYMGGAGKSERDAKLGASSGETLAQLKARTLALNSRHTQLCAQDAVRFNQEGVREQFPPYFTACLAAGMQAGSQVGTSLTRKYPSVLDVIGNDSSYTIRDNGEALINAGLLMLERQPGVGWRFLRNVTTHQKDDNPAYVEAAVNEAVNYIVYNYRTEMEILIGQKGVEATVATAKGLAIGVLGALMDRDVQAMVQWQSLSLELDGDVLTTSVEVAPVESINFAKHTIHLVRATFSAAA